VKAHIDLETSSPIDISAGVHRQAIDPDTFVSCACWAIEDGPVQTWKWGDPPPDLSGLEAAEWWAYNAQFDATMWYHVLHQRCGWWFPGWDRFRCSRISAAYGNLPESLAQVALALGTAEKDKLGHKLMLQLCKPAPETEHQDDPWRRHTPEALARLAAYCAQDVVAERALEPLLPRLPASELALWQLDQTINRRGVQLDLDLVARLKRAAAGVVELHREELVDITGGKVKSETSLQAMVRFLNAQGCPARYGKGCMDADAITALLRRDDLTKVARRVLELRQLLGKSSLQKLKRMEEAVGPDGRIRGTLQFYGAHQTGRWAGRIIQPQNLPRGVFEKHAEYGVALDALALADQDDCPEWLIGLYGQSAMDVLATLIRPCLCAAPGKTLVVADYSAIEARALAWVSGEQWRLEVFRGDGKIYEASASRTLGVPKESIKKGSKERGCGKVTELALGYQGGVGALEKFGAVEDYGIPRERLKPIVDQWRAASPMVVRLWRGLQNAALEAIQSPGVATKYGYARFCMVGPHLRMALPSGRNLWYRDCRTAKCPAPWDEEQLIDQILFNGENQDGGWGTQKAYGGLLTNNLCQGLCRDLMAHAMQAAEAAGLPVVLTVHDELVCEVDEAFPDPVKTLERLMCELPAWARTFPVTAEGWAGKWYRK
jgi:DNA polymerase